MSASDQVTLVPAASPAPRHCPLARDPDRMGALRADAQVRRLLQLFFAASRGSAPSPQSPGPPARAAEE